MSESALILLLQEQAPSLIGLIFALMGYSLIRTGIAASERELQRELSAPEISIGVGLHFQPAMPGILFALFGVALILVQYNAALIVFIQILAIGSGVAFGFMGFQLFSRGVFEASDMEAVWGDRKLLLRRAAPGTVFALFGAFVVVFALWKGPSVERFVQASYETPRQEGTVTGD